MTLCCPMNSLAFVLCVPWLVFNSNILSLNFIKAVPYFWNSCSIFLKVLLYGLIFNNVPLSEFLLKRQTSCLTAPLWGLKVPVVQVLTHTRQVLFFVPYQTVWRRTPVLGTPLGTRPHIPYFFLDQNQFIILSGPFSLPKTVREEHICYQGILTGTCHEKLWSDTCDAQSSHDGEEKPQPRANTGCECLRSESQSLGHHTHTHTHTAILQIKHNTRKYNFWRITKIRWLQL